MLGFIFLFFIIPTMSWAEDGLCKKTNLELLKKLNSISTIESNWVTIDQKNMNIGILDNNRKQLYLYTDKPQNLKSSIANSYVCPPYEQVLIIENINGNINGKAKGKLEVDKLIDQDSTFYNDMNSFPISNEKLNKEGYKSTRIDIVIDTAIHEFFHLKTIGVAGEEKIYDSKSNLKSRFLELNLPLEGSEECKKNKKFIETLGDEFNDLRKVENLLINFKSIDLSEISQQSCNLQTSKISFDLENKIKGQVSIANVAIKQELLVLAEKIWNRRNQNDNKEITSCYNSMRMHERIEGSAVYFSANFNFLKDQMKLNPLDTKNPKTFSNEETSVNYLTGYILLKLINSLSNNLFWQQKIQEGSSLDSVLGDILKANH